MSMLFLWIIIFSLSFWLARLSSILILPKVHSNRFLKELSNKKVEQLFSFIFFAVFFSVFSYFTYHMFYRKDVSDQQIEVPAQIVSPSLEKQPPRTGAKEIIGYAEQREQMTEEIERQSNAVKEHRQLAEELNNRLYVKSDLAGMTDRSEKAAEERREPDPEPAEVTTQADRKKQRTANTQTKPSYEGQIREITVPEERIIRVPATPDASAQVEEVEVTEDVPVYAAPPLPSEVRRQPYRPPLSECDEILRTVNQRMNRHELRKAIRINPVGQPTFFKLDGFMYVITPESRQGDCTFYDVQTKRGGETRHCRRRLCVPR